MKKKTHLLEDRFERKHNYLRISLTERCNLRCAYCMPVDGVTLSPAANLMNANEVFEIARLFVAYGVDKIRLTGGEPSVRKDFPQIVERLSQLPVKLSLTTNAVSIDRHIPLLKASKVNTLNISLDTLNAVRFKKITFRDYFDRVYQNILLLIQSGFQVKINAVLMKGVNEEEILDFIQFTKNHPVVFRFIEFMPFDGNQWNREKTVSYKEIMDQIATEYAPEEILRIQDEPNDTTKNYKIKGYQGSFGVISTVTNPFCDRCNRLRLTANGQLKNCLFSQKEQDLLTAFRNKEDLTPIIEKAVLGKKAVRGGMETPEAFEDTDRHTRNRSMITIGG
ncbi:GTP 3',8-cyclase MoaA [Flavobacteriaceae bacterium]|nr:GTP 3',8-cyclase MoaA [Flavobacteriaceae bacterium]